MVEPTRSKMGECFTYMTNRDTLSSKQNRPDIPKTMDVHIYKHVEESRRNKHDRYALALDEIRQ